MVFGALVVLAIAMDLGVVRRDQRAATEPPLRVAATRTVLWILLSLGFGVAVWVAYGREPAVAYFTAYLVEKSLSLDNLFVFVLVFSYLGIPTRYQRSVLLWGVLGALALRGMLIAGGIFVLGRFHWITYPFAALVVIAAVRLLWGEEKQREVVAAACSVCGTWIARVIPVTPVLHEGRFVVRESGRLVATPLFVALVVIETTDIVFALDSVPAVLAITREPFLVYTSNVFAMLGLRSLYFLIAGVVDRLRYLRPALATILLFVGAKLLLSDVVEVPNLVSLGFIAIVLTVAVLASLRAGVTQPT